MRSNIYPNEKTVKSKISFFKYFFYIFSGGKYVLPWKLTEANKRKLTSASFHSAHIFLRDSVVKDFKKKYGAVLEVINTSTKDSLF